MALVQTWQSPISPFRWARLCGALAIRALLCSLVALGGAAEVWAINFASIRQAVYKINVVAQEPRVSQPWLHHSSTESSGTGFYIGNERILTNAHVVAHAKFITVTRDGSDKAEIARVKFIAHDCDLAILELKNLSSFDDIEALRFSGLPQLRRPVATIGYPLGGEQISITEGVVSRIAYRQYAHTSYHSHILVQVDSAINPGNSGGPVIQGGQVVGVAFQSFNNAENTGYIIPQPVISRFLLDIEDGTYDGHPEDGIVTMDGVMDNPATRFFHGLKAGDHGVKVSYVERYGAAYRRILPGDILVGIAGQAIGNDGKINFQGERLDYKLLFDLAQIGDVVDFRVIREGRLLIVPVKAQPSKPHYLPYSTFGRHPRFLVYSGLVFTALSLDYLRGWGRSWFRDAPILLRYLHEYSGMEPRFQDVRDIVVLASRLPDEINAYAQNYEEKVLTRVNGTEIRSLEDLDRATTQDHSPFVVLEFQKDDAPIVLYRAEATKAHARTVERYGVSPQKWLGDERDDGATAGTDL